MHGSLLVLRYFGKQYELPPYANKFPADIQDTALTLSAYFAEKCRLNVSLCGLILNLAHNFGLESARQAHGKHLKSGRLTLREPLSPPRGSVKNQVAVSVKSHLEYLDDNHAERQPRDWYNKAA